LRRHRSCFFHAKEQRYFFTIENMGNEAPKKHKGGYRQINKTFNICAFDEYLEAQLSRLPEIADVEQISPRVIRVLGQNAGKVRSYLFHLTRVGG